MSSGDGSASHPIKYSSSLQDRPANPSFQPNRYFLKPIQANLITTDVVTECVFHETGTTPKVGGFGFDNLHCFGLLTYSPPYALSICQSIPTEFTLQAAFGFKLKTFNDVQDDDDSSAFKRRRRSFDISRTRTKRQSDDLVNDFLDRDTFVGEVPNTQDSTVQKDLEALLGQSSTRQLSNANLGLIGGEQFPICVGKSGTMLQLKPIEIKSGGSAPPKQAVADCSSIKTTPRPNDEVLNNEPITEAGVTATSTKITTTTTTKENTAENSIPKQKSDNSTTSTTKAPTRLAAVEPSATGSDSSEPNTNAEPEAETNPNSDTRNNEPLGENDTENGTGVVIVPSFIRVYLTAMTAIHSLLPKP